MCQHQHYPGLTSLNNLIDKLAVSVSLSPLLILDNECSMLTTLTKNTAAAECQRRKERKYSDSLIVLNQFLGHLTLMDCGYELTWKHCILFSLFSLLTDEAGSSQTESISSLNTLKAIASFQKAIRESVNPQLKFKLILFKLREILY